MRRAESALRRIAVWLAVAAAAASAAAADAPAAGAMCTGAASDRPVYLTFDTGHMGVAPLVADVLRRQQVKVTFFLANERTRTDGGSLDDEWAPWWKARVAEGHVFGSHTWDHAVWAGDTPEGFKVRPTAGPNTGKTLRWERQDYCDALQRPAQRLHEMAGVGMAPIFRAPGGKTSTALLDAARACGWHHVGWTEAGFLGDELPSERWPNKLLLERALRNIRSGDILLAHLGIWSRKEVWAPGVLEPLIVGLKARGFCFATLRDHPRYQAHFPR